MSKIDPADARKLTSAAVTAWFAARRVKPVDRKKSLSAGAPAGYGMKFGIFLLFCNDIQTTLTAMTGRRVVLPDEWRLAHQSDTVGVYIEEVARILEKAPATTEGAKAHAWARKLTAGGRS